ncbi:MAG: DUF2959 domain-containing protein [Methylococcaceae bacterium]|jgi:hypothetical protein|nr:MAG: DUF2959 domain-containing protein [Methylococcaceae bacterium]
MLRKLKHIYYRAKESLGEHKRTLVVHHVEQACLGLEDTRNEFVTTLEKFHYLNDSRNNSTLSQKYQLLNQQYHYCQVKTEHILRRIKAIEEVSEALFAEWEKELAGYSNKNLKNKSKLQLKTARQNYARLIKTLYKALDKITPVLAAFKDQVLYLKHNLNAQTIAALQYEFTEISIDINDLINTMEQILTEANQFVSLIIPYDKQHTKKLLKN